MYTILQKPDFWDIIMLFLLGSLPQNSFWLWKEINPSLTLSHMITHPREKGPPPGAKITMASAEAAICHWSGNTTNKSLFDKKCSGSYLLPSPIRCAKELINYIENSHYYLVLLPAQKFEQN